MNETNNVVIEDNNSVIRKPNPSDTTPSEPKGVENPFSETNDFVNERSTEVPEEIKKAAYEQSLAQQIREDHEGNVFVIVQTNTSEIVEIVDDLHAAEMFMQENSLSSENTLIVSCHE